MAMVKPTPPKTAAPSICSQVTFSGRLAALSFTTRKLAAIMPSGLPTTRPKNAPSSAGFENRAPKSLPASPTFAFVSANRGRIAKYTQG